MSTRLVAAIMILAFALAPIMGCHSMGKATGKAVKSVEDSADDFRDGYDEGKKQE